MRQVLGYSLAPVLTARWRADDVQLLKVAAQCMANFVTTGAAAAAALWGAAFPAALQHLANLSAGYRPLHALILVPERPETLLLCQSIDLQSRQSHVEFIPAICKPQHTYTPLF